MFRESAQLSPLEFVGAAHPDLREQCDPRLENCDVWDLR
jgi:hypothetical protein